MSGQVVGRSVERLDIVDKVQGQCKYPGDFSMEGMLYGATVWPEYPHARILSIDTSAARAVPGVVDVLTHEDVPVNEYGINELDQQVLCADRVRWVGDRVALVLAETPAAAEEARRLVRVEYEELPLLTDPVEAMAPGAPEIHEGLYPGNIYKRFVIQRGDAEAALASADVVVEGEYHMPFVEHVFMQPEAGLGYIDDQGRVTVVCAGQWPADDVHQIAHALDLPEDQVREIVPAVGGAFGGREDVSLQILLALAAWKTRRPVKIVWTREESLRGHGKRHPFTIRHRWGATRDGKLVAADVRAVADGGPYASTSIVVLATGMTFLAGPYVFPNVRLEGYAVCTNNAVGMAMRGFGATQPPVGYELQMDRLAEALGMDPVELRMRNLLEEGSIAVTGNRMPAGTAMKETLRAAALAAGWRETPDGWQRPELGQAARPYWRRGIGVACAYKNVGYSMGFPDRSTAAVDLFLREDGSIDHAVVRCAAVDVGQGVTTILAQFAAQALGIDLDRVRMAGVDTTVTPNAGSSSASRHTFVSGNAVLRACRAALEKRDQALREETGVTQVSAQVTYEARSARHTTPFDPETGQCEPHVSYGYCTQIAVVDVDSETGAVDLVKLYSATNTGKTVNPAQVYGQVGGGVHMGVGYALTEEFVLRDGRVKTGHLSEYEIPTVADMPCELESIIVEVPDPNGPYGAVGIGEPTTLPTAPAILNAIHDATGAWVSRLPATPERVWRAMRGT